MKRFAFFTLLAIGFGFPMVGGCGGSGENTVIEAPPEMVEEEPAIEGMDDEDYDAAMDEEMNQ